VNAHKFSGRKPDQSGNSIPKKGNAMQSLRILLMMVALLAIVATADAQPTADARVADIVRAGKLRVALFLPQYAKDPATGEISGYGSGTVHVQIAHALAARIGVEVQLLGYPTPPTVVECLKAGACDVGFMGNNPARAVEVGFSAPVILLPFTYLVPAGSAIKSIADADRPGVRIAAVRNHESTLALSHILKHAESVSAEIPDAAFDLLRTGNADAWASTGPALLEYSTKLSGSRVLEDYYGANPLSMAVPKGQVARLAYVSDFVEEAKASGLAQRAIERAGQRGIRVAPPGNPTAQK
jgi:polar amino acid transport system substrate-binding protein